MHVLLPLLHSPQLRVSVARHKTQEVLAILSVVALVSTFLKTV